MTAEQEIGSGEVAALLWVDRAATAWNETIAAMLRMPEIGEIHVGFAESQSAAEVRLKDPRLILHPDKKLVELGELVASRAEAFVLFVTCPCRPPVDALSAAVAWMAQDPRIATMSFLSNSAGALSFPHRNTETPFGVDGHDETTLTKLLRDKWVPGAPPVPIQVAEGPMVLTSRGVLEICFGLDDLGSDNLALAVADLSLRVARRGFLSYLDPSSYVTVPWDGVGTYHGVLTNSEARHALHQRYPYFPGCYDLERTQPHSVLGEALDLARAAAGGVRVLIDGSALGPKEMGTQLLVMKLSLALAARDDVQRVFVGVPEPSALPNYAHELTTAPKIQLVAAGNLDFPGAPMVDIVHRPYQPSSPIPWDRWRQLAKRSVITVQDLIAYRNAAYFRDFGDWQSYRENFLRQIAQVDAVISISHDVVGVIREERLPIDATRVFAVENGADARTRDQPSRIPQSILDRGWASSPFLFVLGATYAHKNRDVAMRVWAELRRRGYQHKLIMAGASVPYGSTRVEESLLTDAELDAHRLNLPDISSEERNWLLGNASLAVYLTAAEGFGQIPFEAARLDVPCLFVSFGPLRELIDDPTLPQAFSLNALVERAEGLLSDPALARASIAGVLKNIDSLSWAETARKTVEAYLAILNQPARVRGA